MESADVEADITAFERRFGGAEALYEKFDAIQAKIETIVIDTNSDESQFAEREQFEDIVLQNNLQG